MHYNASQLLLLLLGWVLGWVLGGGKAAVSSGVLALLCWMYSSGCWCCCCSTLVPRSSVHSSFRCC
jgi:hypothetical protein